jgi:hypothetical protein
MDYYITPQLSSPEYSLLFSNRNVSSSEGSSVHRGMLGNKAHRNLFSEQVVHLDWPVFTPFSIRDTTARSWSQEGSAPGSSPGVSALMSVGITDSLETKHNGGVMHTLLVN